MKIWTAVSNATIGWWMLLKGDPDWRARFALGAPGLVTALLIFAFVAFLAVAAAALNVDQPGIAGLLAAMTVLSLPVLALVISLVGTRIMLKSDAPMLDVLVPGIYASAAFLPFEGLLAVIGGPIVMLAWLALGFLLYRLARAAMHWSAGVAAAFALLSVLLLVAMRSALYMLSNVTPPSV